MSTSHIHHSTFILILVTLYAFLALFAWSVICILTDRPLTIARYGVGYFNGSNTVYGGLAKEVHASYQKNETWYTAARVLQAIVGVLTIPLTSTVCSSAAVVYTQRSRRWPSSDLTLRQMMTLANSGWVDLNIYRRLLRRSGRKRYASPLLLFAMALIILGFVIAPLQQIFLSTKTIKTPTAPYILYGFLDVPDRFDPNDDGRGSTAPIPLTRNALESATVDQFQPLLWSGSNTSCNYLDIMDNLVDMNSRTPNYCNDGGRTLRSISELPDPFLAQLPSGYSTGLLRQFLTRINSTASYEVADEAVFPSDCDQILGAYFAEYSNTTEADGVVRGWSLQACMPGDLRRSPWTRTRARQDFSEELYINVTIRGVPGEDDWNTPVTGELYKVTVNTTAGYFELPNYMNGNMPGPLLDTDLNVACGEACKPQIHSYSNLSHSHKDDELHPSVNYNPIFDFPVYVTNKGPLLLTAMALFGNGSILDNLLTNPDLYKTHTRTDGPTCIDLAPFGIFIDKDPLTTDTIWFPVDRCIRSSAISTRATLMAEGWLQTFRLHPTHLTNAFNAAAFLANQIWMTYDSSSDSLTIAYDMGADSEVPVISYAGIILISVLMGIYILALYAMAVYACLYPRWTDRLDAFAMLRIGSMLGEKMPLKVAATPDDVLVLDETAGWVGDLDEQGVCGRVGLGGSGPLRSRRAYLCYDGQPVDSGARRDTWFNILSLMFLGKEWGKSSV